MAEIKERGYEVRMHSYEYYVRNRKFVFILILNPEWNKATFYRIPWNREASERAIEDIKEAVKFIDPEINISTV